MNINLNASTFKDLFGLRPQYCEFLVVIIRGLFLCETVNLSRLSQVLGYKNHPSCYKRLCRFVDKVHFCKKSLAKAFVLFCGFDKVPKWIVILDRTYWMFGKTHLSFLYMGISTGKYCIPLFFILLGPNKKGSSGYEDRKIILDLFIETFGKEKIDYILGDREFIGRQWLSYLKSLDIPFSQRIREKMQKITNAKGELVPAESLFRHLKVGEYASLGERKIGISKDMTGEIWGLRNHKGELVIVICHKLQDPLMCYKKRWQIEICFRSLKSNGFNIEDSHITAPNRIVCLLSLASLAFALGVAMGEKLHSKKPIKIKKHGYPQSSTLRYALDNIKLLMIRSLSSIKKAKKDLNFKIIIKLVQ